MSKKRTKSEKQRAQLHRHKLAPSPTVASVTGTSTASVPVAHSSSNQQLAGILSTEQQQYLVGDIVRSLIFSGVIGLLLFGIFLYVINAVQ